MGGKTQSRSGKIERELRAYRRPDKAEFLPGFFDVRPGGYGEGDLFIGVMVPDTRKVARRHRDASLALISELLDSRYHEMRLCALVIMVLRFERADADDQAALIELYLDKLDRVNNWDLVDMSAPKLLGAWLLHRDRTLLYELARSGELWRERAAIMATFAFIRAGDHAETEALADILLDHHHDLIHKAVGWMLREVGNRDRARLLRFLRPRYSRMPRTMLRYAIEKLPEPQRKDFLRGRA